MSESGITDLHYLLKAYTWAPITFTKRVLLGRDPYWRQYFFNRWGYLAQRLHTVNRQPTLWIDAQSLGEVNQIKTLIQRLKINLPSWRFVISTNEPSSFSAANAILEGQVFDEPWDLIRPTNRVLAALRPQALLIVEHPQNPVRLFETKRRGARTLLISADFPIGWERMPFMQRSLVHGAHHALDAVAVKTEEDAAQYQRLGVPKERITVVGDLKFDLEFIKERAHKAEAVRQFFQLNQDERWLVGGSVHLGEEHWLLRAWQAARQEEPALRLVLVPRWAEQGTLMAASLRRAGVEVIQQSRWRGGPTPDNCVIIVDIYGELIAWYSIAWAVFLGGSALVSSKDWLGLCHNPIEPLSLGKPVFVGPNHHLRANTCQQLRRNWDGLLTANPEDLARRLIELAKAPALEERICDEALTMTQSQRGVVERYTQWLVRQLILATETTNG